MTTTRTVGGLSAKPTASDSELHGRRIPELESDAFVARLKQVIGDRKLTWFAEECAVGESTLRNILSGAWPRTDLLVRIADAGGVTVDWLATGRPPRTRAELAALLKKGAPAPQGASEGSELWRLAVEVGQEWQVKEGRLLPPDKFLRALELLVELADGEPAQVRALSAKVLRLAA